mmetsp:Transcript_26940/g.43562  ORF Transcript_26940/g.43562 Transcript_26940/m.43562 type:complete len:109 (-) Transcript_26940:76-402(-)
MALMALILGGGGGGGGKAYGVNASILVVFSIPHAYSSTTVDLNNGRTLPFTQMRFTFFFIFSESVISFIKVLERLVDVSFVHTFDKTVVSEQLAYYYSSFPCQRVLME